MPGGFFNEHRFTVKAIETDSLGRSVALPLDFERPIFCEHGEDFLHWVSDKYPTLFDYPQLHELDQAVLTIIYESRYQLQFIEPCSLNTCVKDVADELLDKIAYTREELKRHPFGTAASAGLYLGEEAEEE